MNDLMIANRLKFDPGLVRNYSVSNELADVGSWHI